MGNTSSTTTDDVPSNHDLNTNNGDNSNNNYTDTDDDPFDGIETLGYRVLGVQPNSPASRAGLVSFLDFLIGCNDTMLLGSGQDLLPGMEYDDIDLPSLLMENKNVELEFLVFNIKSQEARLVNLTPSDTWGGAGLLGVTIRLDNYAGAEDRFIRVLSVVENSPAYIAGLHNDGTDFILGTTHHTINSLNHFAQLLYDNLDRIIELYVYNSNTDVVRVVTLLPSYEWTTKGNVPVGSGCLGAEVGTGYLHRLPYKSRSTHGTCVERKVRYVQQPSSEQKLPHGDDPKVKVVLIEDAPQMEMEAPTDDDEDDDNSDHVEEIYTEPRRENHGAIEPFSEQASGTRTSEEEPINHLTIEENHFQQQQQQEQHEPLGGKAAETVHPNVESIASNVHTSTTNGALSTTSHTNAAAILFSKPLSPPPILVNHRQQNEPSTSTNATTSTTTAAATMKMSMSPLGPPPPRATSSFATTAAATTTTTTTTSYGTTIAPQVLSYMQPPPPQQQSYYSNN